MAIIKYVQKTSSKSAGDRYRHKQKVREAIKENLPDIVADESIITQKGNKKIKIPVRGIKEFRFVYGENHPGVGEGSDGLRPGDVVGQRGRMERGVKNQPGNQPGDEYYEVEVDLEELQELMFEDLALPDIAKKKLREIEYITEVKHKGYRKHGIRPRLAKKKTAIQRIKRQQSILRDESCNPSTQKDSQIPFDTDDLRYHYVTEQTKKESNAVVIAMMDVSGSMDMIKKYLARSFYFFLYRFVKRKYKNVDMVFLAHHTEAWETNEHDFFHREESGGTIISSVYKLALEIINARYRPSLWNIYPFHISDGENYDADNSNATKTLLELCKVANLVGYGEIKTDTRTSWGSIAEFYTNHIKAENFKVVKIRDKVDVWKALEDLLSIEKAILR